MKFFEYLHEVGHLSNLVSIHLLFTRKVSITSALASSFTNRQPASWPLANRAVDASRLGLRNVMSSGFPWLRLACSNESRSYYKVRCLVQVWRRVLREGILLYSCRTQPSWLFGIYGERSRKLNK